MVEIPLCISRHADIQVVIKCIVSLVYFSPLELPFPFPQYTVIYVNQNLSPFVSFSVFPTIHSYLWHSQRLLRQSIRNKLYPGSTWTKFPFFHIHNIAVVQQRHVNSNRQQKNNIVSVCGWENSCDGKTLIFPGRRVSAEISQTSEITGAKLLLHKTTI